MFRTLLCAARLAILGAALLSPAVALLAATTLNGSDLVLRSSGSVSGTDVTLSENGYAGTYLVLAAPGVVTVSVDAFGSTPTGILPRLSVTVADSHADWLVDNTTRTYATQFTLPAGIHFVRVEFNNAVAASGSSLTIHSVSIDGATVDNSNTTDDLNRNALAASDTYIANFRVGHTSIVVPGVGPGTPVHVELVQHAFRFATEVPGTSTQASVDLLLGDNPAPGSDAANYQERLLENFNGMTPGNAGKWDSNEATQAQLTMGGIDRILQYGAEHGLRIRQHNLIWGMQQPTWVTQLTAEAALPSPAGDSGKAALMSAIQSRIGYYVHDRSTLFEQLDVYNESVHTGSTIPGASYWSIYGPAGIAEIYNQVEAAANQAGADVKLCTNEYNVLCDGNDAYANWYREHIESILSAGGSVTGVGSQYYSHESIGTGNSAHNASRIFGALNNLGVLGLPLELTEFGIKNDGTGTAAQNSQTDAQILDETLRLVFGNPQATGFTIWGFWSGDVWNQAPDAVLYDQTWNITPAGQVYLQRLGQDWNTTVDTTTDANGAVNFDGFYGRYVLTAGSTQYVFNLTKGALPDLAVSSSDLALSKTRIATGDTALVMATIHNPGGAAAQTVPVRFTDNGNPIGNDQVIQSIAVNGSAKVSLSWPTKHFAGTHDIAVTVDPNGAIAEITKANNTASTTVTIKSH